MSKQIEAAQRDALGFCMHEEILKIKSENKYIDLSKIEAFKDRNVKMVHFDIDASRELVSRYYSGKEYTIPAWQPTPPGAGWVLIALINTDDGPIAWFVSPTERE